MEKSLFFIRKFMVLQWSLYYKATHFADRFCPYKGDSLCRQVNLVIKWKVDAEGSGLMIQVVLCSKGPYSTGTTVVPLLKRPSQQRPQNGWPYGRGITGWSSISV